MSIYRLKNTIQNYAWGSTTAIAELLGRPSPSPDPEAELWMGSHIKGPSLIVDGKDRIPLQQLIDRQPVDILGRYVAERFGNALPYLFKVLAAAQPLSIQAHPSKAQAIEGFSRENQGKKALNAPDRNYRDDNHKPEIICALTPFWGLNGFRSAPAAIRLLEAVCPKPLETALLAFKRQGASGIREFFESMMTLAPAYRKAAAREIREKAQALHRTTPVYRCMTDLAETYSDDMGILSPALLNLVCLQPGQAMFLPSGQLHAYLDGVGIELMANSDNVLRGGLTPKHVDVAELLAVVQFVETHVTLIEPETIRPGESGYPCPAEEFALSVVRVDEGQPYVAPTARSVEILLCTSGDGHISASKAGPGHSVRQGDSFLVPAVVGSYLLQGNLVLYKASVPSA